MGNSKSFSNERQTPILLKIRPFVNAKHKDFKQLRNQMIKMLAKVSQDLQRNRHFQALNKTIEMSSSQDCTVPLHELSSYIVSTIEDSLINGKEFLKSKRKEFFLFARQNLLNHDNFILCRVIQHLNCCSKDFLDTFEEISNDLVSELLTVTNKLVKHIIKWFYGSKILCGLSPLATSQETEERVEEVYLSELSEYILFFEKSQKNFLFKLRFRQIERQTTEVQVYIIQGVRELRHAGNPRTQNLFPNNDENSYDIILDYLEKLAHASLLTTKYKFICIILETIPSLFMQSELRRYKQSSLNKRTFCMTPDRRISTISPHSGTITGSFGRNYQLENNYSQLLSVDSKRQLAKYLLVQWFKSTNYCIIQDVYLPLQLLQRDSYINNVSESMPLATFMHALYEIIGVRPDIIDQQLF